MKNGNISPEKILDNAKSVKAMARDTVSAHRNLALTLLSDAIRSGEHRILEANEKDLARAKKKGADELTLSGMRLDVLKMSALVGRIRTMAAKDDPTDKAEEWRCENGLTVSKIRVPLGIIATVSGNDPRRAIESAAQAIKTGNVMIILESPITPETDRVFKEILQGALSLCAIHPDTVQTLPYSPENMRTLITATDTVDALILLGSKKQNNHIRKNTSIPIIASDTGTSHLYIDKGADVSAAAKGVAASFTSGAALNTVLVNWMVSDDFLPVLEGVAMEAGIELLTDIRSRSTLHGTEGYKDSHLKNADGRLLIVTVNSLEDAVRHIEKYGDGVCEGIYTNDGEMAERFCASVDAGTVMVNAALSHANGYDAGLGAEVGLGADKLSGRGLFGLDKLTAVKYIVKR